MSKKVYFDLSGDVAVITGASSGLGVQFAKVLANQGASIALIARREEKLKAVKEEIEKYGVKCEYYTLDVKDSPKIKSTVEQIEKDFGKIDILINNAGVGGMVPSVDLSEEDWKNCVDINLSGVFFMARECAKVMLKHKYGRIINIGSIHSTVSLKSGAINSYGATKGGVMMLSKVLATEWALDGITVNTLGPGYFGSEMTEDVIDTPQFQAIFKANCPMERSGREGELDTAILLFASRESSYLTGQYLAVDGGWTAM